MKLEIFSYFLLLGKRRRIRLSASYIEREIYSIYWKRVGKQVTIVSMLNLVCVCVENDCGCRRLSLSYVTEERDRTRLLWNSSLLGFYGSSKSRKKGKLSPAPKTSHMTHSSQRKLRQVYFRSQVLPSRHNPQPIYNSELLGLWMWNL